jgi:hypothetical protein
MGEERFGGAIDPAFNQSSMEIDYGDHNSGSKIIKKKIPDHFRPLIY